jgi:ketosteroid isomerase-like protein
MRKGRSPQELAKDWLEAWNRHDLEAIIAHYADDVRFEAPTVVVRWGKTDGVLRGKAELREHFRRGLELVPGLRFDLEEIFLSPAGYAILYRRENGNRVVDVVELNEAGQIQRARALYTRPQS